MVINQTEYVKYTEETAAINKTKLGNRHDNSAKPKAINLQT